MVVLENFVFVGSNSQQMDGTEKTSTPFSYEKAESKGDTIDTPFNNAADEDVPF